MSVSEEDAQEVGDSDGGDLTRPLLRNYTVNSDRQAQESEPDGEINRLPLLVVRSDRNEIGEQKDYTNIDFEQLLGK